MRLVLDTRTLDHVIVDHHEERTKLPVKSGADLAQDLLQLGLSEVGRECLHGLKEVVGLDATVGSVRLGRRELEQGPRLISCDLHLGAGIRSEVTLAIHSENSNANQRARGNSVTDGNVFESCRAVFTTDEERAERVPDQLRIHLRAHLNEVLGFCVLVAAGVVLDVGNGQFLLKKDGQNSLDVLGDLDLPLLGA